MDYNRRALEADPATFPAANDLGVALARSGDNAEAAAAFRRAIGAAEDYALGWFNLGVVQTRRGPAYVLAAQGALARAHELDPGLADRARTPTADETTYRTGLDLSRPLPPRWSFARLQQMSPATSAGLLAVVMLGLGRSLDRARSWSGARRHLARCDRPAAGADTRPEARTQSGLGRGSDRAGLRHSDAAREFGAVHRPPGRSGRRPRHRPGALLARALYAARHRLRAEQESWAPAMVFGTAAAFVGAPWAPLPVVRAGSEQTIQTEPGGGPIRADQPPAGVDSGAVKVHAAAPVTLGVLALILFIEAAWWQMPLVRAWAIAALIMAASTLVPVKPLDGARLGKAGVIGSIGVLAGAVLVVLGVM